jgi:hypothetical protein
VGDSTAHPLDGETGRRRGTFATYDAEADTGNGFRDALTNGYVAGVLAGVLDGDPVTFGAFVGEYSAPLLSTHPYYDPRAYQ